MTFTEAFDNKVEFESPATRIIKQFSGKDEEQFKIPTNLPDITFLRALSIQGRLRYVLSDLEASAAALFTPVEGETFFMYRISLFHTGSGTGTFLVVNDGNTRFADTRGVGNSTEYNIVDSLVGNGSKTIGVTSTSTANANRITMLGWVENTSRIRDVAI